MVEIPMDTQGFKIRPACLKIKQCINFEFVYIIKIYNTFISQKYNYCSVVDITNYNNAKRLLMLIKITENEF